MGSAYTAENTCTMRSIGLLFLLLLSFGAHAQLGGRGTLGGHIGTMRPMEEHGGNWERGMLSMGGHISVPMRLLPLQTGFRFNRSLLGTNGTMVYAPGHVLENPRGEVQARIHDFLPFVRLNPIKGKVRPYGELLAGVRHFRTDNVVVRTSTGSYSTHVGDSNIAWTSGWAAGLMVGLGKVGYFEARVERLYGSSTALVDPTTITMNAAGGVGYSVHSGPTGSLAISIGAGLNF